MNRRMSASISGRRPGAAAPLGRVCERPRPPPPTCRSRPRESQAVGSQSPPASAATHLPLRLPSRRNLYSRSSASGRLDWATCRSHARAGTDRRPSPVPLSLPLSLTSTTPGSCSADTQLCLSQPNISARTSPIRKARSIRRSRRVQFSVDTFSSTYLRGGKRPSQLQV